MCDGYAVLRTGYPFFFPFFYPFFFLFFSGAGATTTASANLDVAHVALDAVRLGDRDATRRTRLYDRARALVCVVASPISPVHVPF